MRALLSEKKKRSDEDSYAAEIGPLMRETWLSYDISICIAEYTGILYIAHTFYKQWLTKYYFAHIMMLFLLPQRDFITFIS